jgi:hypothetical protein
MKFFRRFIATVVLTVSLTFVAFAGEIQAPGETTPPADSTPCTTGEIQAPGVVAPDSVTTVTLNVIQSLMTVL